jgi:catechol 1,2-dioxygenase
LEKTMRTPGPSQCIPSSASTSRRSFLQLLSLAPGAAVLSGNLLAACADEGSLSGAAADAAGGADGDGGGAGGPDAADLGRAGSSDADTAAEVGADAPAVCEATASDVQGPFHLDGAPSRTVLAAADEAGDRLWITGRVTGPDCRTGIPGALLDVWQADHQGVYGDETRNYRLRGQMLTDAQGRFQLETIRPGNYPLGGSMRPRHIHFMVTSPDHVPLTTQLYFRGDPYLAPNDPCGDGCNSDEASLIIDLVEARRGEVDGFEGVFDIVLRELA